MKDFETLFNSLKASGFNAPCAADMSNYLISCLSRPLSANSLTEIKEDIDKVIKALEALKTSI